MAAAFGKATFIHDQDGKGRGGLSTLAGQGRRGESVPEEATQLIAHAVVIPDGLGKQTLHGIRTGVFGVFGDLPAIFPGDVTDDGVQVEQGVTARLGARKTGRQARMQMEQAQGPAGNLAQRWLGWLWCGMVRRLHAFLVSDGRTTRTRGMCSGSVSHLDEMGTKSVLLRGIFPGKWLSFPWHRRFQRRRTGSEEYSRENGSLYKCHCSE